MKKWWKYILVFLVSFVALVLAVFIGSTHIPPGEVIEIIFNKLTFKGLGSTNNAQIIWNLRVSRALLSFFVGALISVSGVAVQSILQNPLASPYTLGVSSGAAFGVAVYIHTGASMAFLGLFARPVVGIICGVLTLVIAVAVASRLDGVMSNNNIVLLGMAFSLFVDAMLSLVMSLSKETLEQVVSWQRGSFAAKDWSFVAAIFPVMVVGIIVMMFYSRELDSLTFGEDSAFVAGVNVKQTKWVLLALSAALTGSAVSLVGVVGFVDLVIPHVTRRIFGSSHRIVIPMSAVLGGAFLCISDIIARTVPPTGELPIGVVTALVGVPFFIYIYFKRSEKSA